MQDGTDRQNGYENKTRNGYEDKTRTGYGETTRNRHEQNFLPNSRFYCLGKVL